MHVPPKNEACDGNLVLWLDDQELGFEGNKGKIVNIATGPLCLFPSSLMHYSIPFESATDRLVLAFDLVPHQENRPWGKPFKDVFFHRV